MMFMESSNAAARGKWLPGECDGASSPVNRWQRNICDKSPEGIEFHDKF